MKTKLLQFHNFIQREFYPDSRQYFEQRFYSAFDLISFNNNQVVHWDNKKEFEFFSIQKQYPFIDDLIPYRKNLIKKIGEVKFYALESVANITRKFTIAEVKEINEIYKEKVRILKNNT